MEKKGIVKDIRGDKVTLSVYLDEGCKNCGMCAGCSDAAFGRELFSWEVQKGDKVIINTESEYGVVVFLIYRFPIFIRILAAAIFFFCSFPLIRVLGKRVTSRSRVTVTQERGE